MTRYSSLKALLAVISGAIILGACSSQPEPQQKSPYGFPQTKTVNQTDNYHGTTVADPYRWLEKLNSNEVEQWVTRQNKFSTPSLQQLPAYSELKQRLTELWNYKKIGTPFQYANRYFYFANDGLQSQDILYTMTALDSAPEILINPNKLSEDGTLSLARIQVSPNAKYIAYSVSEKGSDWNHIRVKNIESGSVLSERIEGVKFSNVAWLPNENGFYYSRYPQHANGKYDDSEPVSVYFHRIGRSQKDDELIFALPEQPSWNPYPEVTHDGRYLLINVSSGYDANAVFSRPLSEDDAPFTGLLTKWDGQYDYVTSHNNKLLFRTTAQAPRGRVIAIDMSDTGDNNWSEIIPENTHTLTSVSAVNGQLFAHYLQNAHSRVGIFNQQGQLLQELALPGIGTVSGFNGSPSADDTFFNFSGFTEPGKIYRYQVAQQRTTLWQEVEFPAELEPYETHQVIYESKDGTEIPMFLVHSESVELDGTNPTLLYGYGGFNISLTPEFKADRIAWLEMGGVLAIPNLRGGGEFGEQWHQAGTKANKQTVFDDFITAAEWLIKNNYTNRDKLAIHGRSNGGLLVGATMTQRPELFAAAIPTVGVLDMLRYHLPNANARGWGSEFGLSENADEFAALYEYSPVHNTKAGTCYPATLVTTANNDNRVAPWHSYKFAAALQADQSCDNPVLLNVETRAGHGAGTPTWMKIESAAEKWAFLHKELNVNKEKRSSASQ
ncbi:S9 family peptidase [Idiomarina sp. X4]|uniref:prolyl oligopeptidase family serine peptidase n=1 Tax=Idiomarina sp. X4 TaxID=2055892 RepID=UPI000C292295|nr:prolyl oligopeptidase family serine peptidase [Idiomarina sp. X4]ATZ73743.1 S9 family peptidase [Idiomarina sp. X4]